MGSEGQFGLEDPHALQNGRFDSAYRATVVETIGGGASEIQKNIIARRGLGLPKNFSRPDLTLELGTPNACNQGGCHSEKSTEWAVVEYEKWYGRARKPHSA